MNLKCSKYIMKHSSRQIYDDSIVKAAGHAESTPKMGTLGRFQSGKNI